MLFRDDRLVALIDFDDAHEGSFVADVVVMVENWAYEKGLDGLSLEKAVTVVREYERHRRLTNAERELLPDFVLMYLLCDTAAYVRERLEQGADGNASVTDSEVYQLYLRHAKDGAWLAALREEIKGRRL